MTRFRVRGFSLVELLIVVTIIVILAAMAIPNLHHGEIQAMEAGALQAIRTIHTAQAQYYSQYGRYAATLREMGPPASGRPTPESAGLMDETLAGGQKGGYRFGVKGSPEGYTINAEPLSFGGTGEKTFYSDETLTIRRNLGPEPATASSDVLK